MKKFFCWILLFALLISAFSLYGCGSSDGQTKSNSQTKQKNIKITKENFEEYFFVSVEFQNVQWCTTHSYNTNTNYYAATADLHIKIINKKNIEGVTVKLDINLTNNGQGMQYWINAKRTHSETISKTIVIAPQGVTDISIPRSTLDDKLTSRVSPPSEQDIAIVIVDVITE